MRVILKSTGQTGTIPDNKFDPNLFSPVTSTPTRMPVQQPGFIQNAAQDLSSNIEGIVGLPKLFMNIGQGLVPGGQKGVSLGEVGGSMLSQILTEGKELMTDPSGTFKKKPVTTLLNILPFLQMGKAKYLSSVGKTADTLGDVGRVGKLADTTSNAGRLESFINRVQEPSTAATNIRRSILKPDVPVGPTSLSKELELTKVAKSLGLRGSANAQRLQIDQLFNSYNKVIGETLASSTKVHKISDLDSIIKSTLDENGRYFIPGDKSYIKLRDRELARLVKKADGGNLTSSDIFDFKNQLDVGNAFKKEKGAITSPLTAPEQVRLDIWRSIDDYLQKAEPGIKPLTKTQAKLHELSPGIQKSAEYRIKLPPPIFGQLPTWATEKSQALRSGLADILDMTPTKIASTALGEAGSLAKKSLSTPTSRALTTMLGRSTAIPGQSEQQTGGGEVPDAATMLNEYDSYVNKGSEGMKITPEMLSMGYLSLSDKNVARLQKMYDAQKGSAEEEKQARAKEVTARIVKQLEDLYFSGSLAGGRIGGTLSTAGSLAGINPELNTYLNLRKSVAPTLARAAGDVGNLSEGEQKAAVGLLPTGFSTPEEARMRFAELRARFGLPPRSY